MKDTELKDWLMETARDAGICAEGYAQMRAYDRDELIDFYVKNPDWCLERGFPDLHTLEESFADCGDAGVFVGRKFNGEVLDGLQTYIFHNCRGTIKTGLNVEQAIIPMLYLANGCRLRIVGTGPKTAMRDRPVVPVYSFGHNDVSARDNAYVRFNKMKRDLL